MTWIEWTAIIGAGAWVPQIINFFYHKLSKPKLALIPESTIEVGYSFFGPILNISYAISASKKDALIEKLTIKIVHETTKEEHEFAWQFLDEKGFEATSSKGEILQTRKSQTAIALKVGILGLVEKKVIFNDPSLLKKRKELENSLYEQEDFLKRTNPQKYPGCVFQTREYSDLNNFFKTSFYWKEGTYKLYVYINEISSRKPHCKKFNFYLKKRDVERLERNIETTQSLFKSSIKLRTGLIKELPYYIWDWVYPSVNRI